METGTRNSENIFPVFMKTWIYVYMLRMLYRPFIIEQAFNFISI